MEDIRIGRKKKYILTTVPLSASPALGPVVARDAKRVGLYFCFDGTNGAVYATGTTPGTAQLLLFESNASVFDHYFGVEQYGELVTDEWYANHVAGTALNVSVLQIYLVDE